MGKYTSSMHKRSKPKPEGPHFIWRGIGCLMLLIVPIISIAAGIETIRYGLEHDWTIPYQLLGMPRLPDLFYKSSGLMTIFSPMLGIRHFYAYAVTSILYMILIGGISSVAYSMVYRLIGPPRYGPLDMPPPKIKIKKYTR